MKIINLADFQISNNNQLILIAGPCVIESEQHSFNDGRTNYKYLSKT